MMVQDGRLGLVRAFAQDDGVLAVSLRFDVADMPEVEVLRPVGELVLFRRISLARREKTQYHPRDRRPFFHGHHLLERDNSI
jgi:hypothetical protein